MATNTIGITLARARIVATPRVHVGNFFFSDFPYLKSLKLVRKIAEKKAQYHSNLLLPTLKVDKCKQTN